MAGISNNPNSPRQRMINLMYLVFIAMMALNVSSEVLDGLSWWKVACEPLSITPPAETRS